jgi:hypothetical protein
MDAAVLEARNRLCLDRGESNSTKPSAGLVKNPLM